MRPPPRLQHQTYLYAYSIHPLGLHTRTTTLTHVTPGLLHCPANPLIPRPTASPFLLCFSFTSLSDHITGPSPPPPGSMDSPGSQRRQDRTARTRIGWIPHALAQPGLYNTFLPLIVLPCSAWIYWLSTRLSTGYTHMAWTAQDRSLGFSFPFRLDYSVSISALDFLSCLFTRIPPGIGSERRICTVACLLCFFVFGIYT